MKPKPNQNQTAMKPKSQLAAPDNFQPSTCNLQPSAASSPPVRIHCAFQNTSRSRQLPVAPVTQPAQVPITPDGHLSAPVAPGPGGTHRDLPGPIGPEINFPGGAWFLPTQVDWLSDPWHLRIREKSRQVGATITDALHTVLIVSVAGARFDVWVTSRDEMQSNLYGEDVACGPK